MIIEAAVCALGQSVANFPGELPTVAVVKMTVAAVQSGQHMLAIWCHIQFGKKHEHTDSICI